MQVFLVFAFENFTYVLYSKTEDRNWNMNVPPGWKWNIMSNDCFRVAWIALPWRIWYLHYLQRKMTIFQPSRPVLHWNWLQLPMHFGAQSNTAVYTGLWLDLFPLEYKKFPLTSGFAGKTRKRIDKARHLSLWLPRVEKWRPFSGCCMPTSWESLVRLDVRDERVDRWIAIIALMFGYSMGGQITVQNLFWDGGWV